MMPHLRAQAQKNESQNTLQSAKGAFPSPRSEAPGEGLPKKERK
jgi:hypothetical protein